MTPPEEVSFWEKPWQLVLIGALAVVVLVPVLAVVDFIIWGLPH